MARFFIDRPVFAWVVSILIMLMGALAITKLPVAQYPSIAPPSVSVTATYAGASAEILQDTVTSVIEQQMNGIDRLLYISSTSDSSGQSTITLYFEPGTNPDIAQVQVQNKLQLATPSLPQVVQQQGIVVAKATRNYLMFFTLSATNGSMDEIALGNYIAAHILDPVRRVDGVGEADEFGTEYAMRIWMDPTRLNSFNLTAGDVIAAIQAQNIQVPVGQIGDLPAPHGQELNITMQGQSTLRTVAEFENILLHVNLDGSRVRLRDVAKVSLGGQNYVTQARVNGVPAAAVGIKLTPTANALNTAEAVRAKVAELSKLFPPGIKVDYPYDSSTFVHISIVNVVVTLFEAIGLVFIVIFIFLQNIRATFIPTIVVPIALLGTFTIMFAFGFSINVLTLFGVVLAIGLLVDDAIVVVENVERIMNEEGLSPRDATRKAMEQITGALIAITLVLTAVFIPMAFFGGSVGAIYRQFSLAMVAAMLFSIFLAMSLTPALCATLLKPMKKGEQHEKRGPFGWFNRSFKAGTTKYQSVVARILKKAAAYLILYAVILLVVGLLYVRLPSSFLPEEDQGYFITAIQLPVGATQQRTLDVVKQVEAYYKKQPEISDVIALTGFSFNGRGQNAGIAFSRLKDWSVRKGAAHHVQAIIGRAFVGLSGIKDAIIYPINPPAISELGNSAGFDYELEDLGSLGHAKLMAARNQLFGMAAQNPLVTQVRPQGMEDTAELKIDIDRDKATTLGVALGDINTTFQTDFGSFYINNFVDGNRVQQVIAMLDAPYRMLPDDIQKVFVRNSGGTMVPLSAFTTMHWVYGSPRLERYNGFPSLEIVGTASPGKSSGVAMQAIEDMVKKLPPGISGEWTGQSYEERLSGSQAPALYTISLLVVFLCLAALYESWSIPLAVILVVPLGVLGALVAATMCGL
ncbi:MAG TPA: efflux RND transporter permease subunit, partial [Candidatus Acidoferrum sp.]|nr:efflux RND transporter permease subunit [Candidatus Acidoferrum sp.]